MPKRKAPTQLELWRRRRASAVRPRTKLPFLATITTPDRSYVVEVLESGMRFVRGL